MEHLDIPLPVLRRKIDDVQRFLSIALPIANAHTVDFYTRNVWDEFMALSPQDVLSQFNGSPNSPHGTPEEGTKENNFGFSHGDGKLMNIGAFLEAAETHALPRLDVSVPLEKLVEMLSGADRHTWWEAASEADEFMNCKKAHEVHAMSEVVAALVQHCRVKQVIDVGSGKGYLSSHLSMQCGLQVFGIDSSSTNTHGAQERNRKLKRYSRGIQKLKKEPKAGERPSREGKKEDQKESMREEVVANEEGNPAHQQGIQLDLVAEEPVEVSSCLRESVECAVGDGPLTDPFLSALALNAVEPVSARVPPDQLSEEERDRRMRENLDRKLRNERKNSSLFLPVTSYVTAETELRDVIPELEDAVMVGLHTCGDLAPSTLRMFAGRPELRAVCSVGCCYHLLSEEFDQKREHHTIAGTRQSSPETVAEVSGFPLSQHLRDQAYSCGRNARMSACLALERVTVGGGLPVESLFYRAVLHVILQDHYGAHKSEKRVGNIYSKASSFVDYIRRALRKLELDESKLSDGDIQEYHDQYKHRKCEMLAFNRLKVTLAPCIEGLILLDRLCYLKEQDNVSFGALVQLFNPLMSPRCYGLVALKNLP